MSIKFLVLGGGGYFGFCFGGGSADFIFMGARIFLILQYVIVISPFPRVCKPWLPNRGSRFATKQRFNRG